MEVSAVRYTRWNCGQYWPQLELTFHIAKSYNIGIKSTLDLTKSLKCPTIPPCITVGCFVTCKWSFLLERLLISYKLRVQAKLTEIIHILGYTLTMKFKFFFPSYSLLPDHPNCFLYKWFFQLCEFLAHMTQLISSPRFLIYTMNFHKKMRLSLRLPYWDYKLCI